MKQSYKKLAPIGLYLSLISAAVALGLYIVQRQFNLPLQIAIGVVVLGFALAVLLDPQNTKEFFTGRQGKNTSNAFLMIVAVLGILVVINYLGYANTKRWDLTEGKQNSLTPESLSILESLPSKVTVTGYFSMRFPKDDAVRLLENYKSSAKGNFDYKFIDPEADPAAAQKAQITRDGTMVLTLDGRSEQVTYADEKEISGAIIRLANPGKRNVYFLTGHGEYELEGTEQNKYGLAKTALVGKNYTVQTLNLLNSPSIPEDALAIVIAGEKTALNEKEVALIKSYLEKGKAIVWMKNPSVESGIISADDKFSAYLKSDWGITVDDDLVIDPNMNPPTVTIADKYGNHPITNKLQGLVTLFPGARSVQYDEKNAKVVGYSLVSSSKTSWGETDLANISNQQVSPDAQKDRIGPIDVAIAAKNIETNGRLVIIGDAEFATDNNFTQYGNGTLLTNAIDWAAGQEDLLNLTPRENVQRVLVPPTVFTNGIILLITVFLVPGLILVAGIVTWIQRKKRG
ncbi:MAG: Gldg family protein [Leptolinea sp.]